MSTPRDRLIQAAAQPGSIPSGEADRGAVRADGIEAVVPVVLRARSVARLRPASRAGRPDPFTPPLEVPSNVQRKARCFDRSARGRPPVIASPDPRFDAGIAARGEAFPAPRIASLAGRS